MIFVSYRRQDSKWIAGRIHDRLVARYGDRKVLIDIDAIPAGLDFREHLQKMMRKCKILIALIGPDWIGKTANSQIRLSDEADWVRVELETALRNDIPILPVLIDDVTMPDAAMLPSSLHPFVFRQAAEVRTGKDFNGHIDRLCRSIDKLLKDPQQNLKKRRLLGPAAQTLTDTGQISTINIPTSTEITFNVNASERASNDLGAYYRHEMRNYVGSYLFIRPSASDPTCLQLHAFHIDWDPAKPGLAMRQGGVDVGQIGYLSIPRSSMHVFVTSNDDGWLKLLVLTQLNVYRKMFGLLLTPGGVLGGVYIPVAMPAVLRKVEATKDLLDAPRVVKPDEPIYNDLMSDIRCVTEDGYAKNITFP